MTSFGERFLRSSQQELRGERSETGRSSLELRIGNAEYAIAGLPEVACRLLDDEYGDLAVDSGHPRPAATQSTDSVSVDVQLVPARHFLDLDPNRQVLDFDQEFHRHEVLLCGRNIVARFTVEPVRMATLWVSEAEEALWADLVGTCLRLLVAYRSLESGGALLHSAAMLSSRGANLLVGNRGSGKTSLSRLALEQGRDVLSDDLNAIVPAGDGFEVLKMPFAGDLGRTTGEPGHAFPLAACYYLNPQRKGTEPVTRAQALASLTAASCFVNRDPYRHEALAEVLQRFSEAAAGRWLDSRDETAVERFFAEA